MFYRLHRMKNQSYLISYVLLASKRTRGVHSGTFCLKFAYLFFGQGKILEKRKVTVVRFRRSAGNIELSILHGPSFFKAYSTCNFPSKSI